MTDPSIEMCKFTCEGRGAIYFNGCEWSSSLSEESDNDGTSGEGEVQDSHDQRFAGFTFVFPQNPIKYLWIIDYT